MVVRGESISPFSDRGRFQTVHESGCSRRVEPEDLPQDCNGVRHLGNVVQGDRLFPEDFVNFRPQLEEGVRVLQEFIGQEGEHR